ncbi:MAG: hypothetical protein WDN04_26655 [Rhodospirillales bacterium]
MAAHRGIAFGAWHFELAEELRKRIVGIELRAALRTEAESGFLGLLHHADVDHRRPVLGDDGAEIRQGDHARQGTARRRRRLRRRGLRNDLRRGIDAKRGMDALRSGHRVAADGGTDDGDTDQTANEKFLFHAVS